MSRSSLNTSRISYTNRSLSATGLHLRYRVTSGMAAFRCCCSIITAVPSYSMSSARTNGCTVMYCYIAYVTTYHPSTALPIITMDCERYRTNFDLSSSLEKPHARLQSVLETDFCVITSGTTGSPKCVAWTHNMLANQQRTLFSILRWSSDDHILNALRLHHIQELINEVL